MYVVVENNGLAQPKLVFSNPSSFDITIQVMVTDITAIGVNNTECTIINSENDYTMGLYDVIFPANVTTRVIDIPICDDIVLEGNESFNVLIVSDLSLNDVASGGSGGSGGALDQATVIIVDDDCEFLIYQ